MKTRIVRTNMWRESLVNPMNIDTKLIYMYLLTNERAGLTDYQQIIISEISLYTGIEPNLIELCLNQLQERKLLRYAEGWIKMTNGSYVNSNYKGINVEKARIEEYQNIPKNIIDLLEPNDDFQVPTQAPGQVPYKSKIKNQKSKIKNQKSEIKNQKSELDDFDKSLTTESENKTASNESSVVKKTRSSAKIPPIPRELTDKIVGWIKQTPNSHLSKMYNGGKGYFQLIAHLRIIGQKSQNSMARNCEHYLSGAKLQYEIEEHTRGTTAPFLTTSADLIKFAEISIGAENLSGAENAISIENIIAGFVENHNKRINGDKYAIIVDNVQDLLKKYNKIIKFEKQIQW